jgi:signal transduction histidine kinase
MWMVEKQLLSPNYKILDFATDILPALELQLVPQFEANKMTLKKSIPAGKIILMADENMLEIILRNLLENAARYGIPGTTVLLSVRQDKHYLDVSVKNKVDNLQADFCANIFQRSQQLKGRGQQGGLGIGLFNVKNLIDLHKGQIQCKLVKPDYIEFYFKIPSHLPT